MNMVQEIAIVELDRYTKLEALLISSDKEIERLQAIVGDSED